MNGSMHRVCNMFVIPLRNSMQINKICPLISIRYVNKTVRSSMIPENINQIEYLRSAIESKVSQSSNWSDLKNDILNIRGHINHQNIDNVMLKLMTKNGKFDEALAFANHLRSENSNLGLGCINGILGLYYRMSKTRELSDGEKKFILDTYDMLYSKYQVLDFTTSEVLLHALCAISDLKKVYKVLADIKVTSTPTHSAYSTTVATLFKTNKKTEAMKVIQESVGNNRPLQDIVYQEWVNYILRKYKTKQVIVKHMDEICLHLLKNFETVSMTVAKLLKQTYLDLGWSVEYTQIRKFDGQCACCKSKLDLLKLTEEEFTILQENVKNKLLVGSDLFIKTSPKELQRFSLFLEETKPYDIVIDCLNVAYAVGKGTNYHKAIFLNQVVDYFKKRNKRILLLGRKHMLNWQQKTMRNILLNTCNFFTEDISQDDPFFITAAIISGSHTDIISRDLLRGHRFLLKDEKLNEIFQRWQWQHQWMIFRNNMNPFIKEPLNFTPCVQKKNSGWHIPYESEHKTEGEVNYGIPDLKTWLCIRPNT